MKITFYSNYFNHHQLYICKKLYELCDGEFKFVATQEISEQRLKLGYKNMNLEYDFIIRAYESESDFKVAKELANTSDIVIIGSAPEVFIKQRIEDNKIIFRYSERVYKTGRWKAISLRGIKNMLKIHTVNREKNIYMLCASAYAAKDFKLFYSYIGKSYKWGYFPEFKIYEEKYLLGLKEQNNIKEILWCGRFLDWKHPEKALLVAKELKKKNYKFTMKILGTGKLEECIRTLIKEYNLTDEVQLVGAVNYKDVRMYMERANIFLFTSDMNEGWGAVLNEALNSGCAVVADRRIGSVPYLINHGENGYIYNNDKELVKCVEGILDDYNIEKTFCTNAYKMIEELWNPEEAASRLFDLCTALLNGTKLTYLKGPCSLDDGEL